MTRAARQAPSWRPWRRPPAAARLARLLPALGLAAGMLMAGGCASTGDDEADQIKQLQARVIDLQRRAAVSDVELARLRQQLAELTGASAPAPSAAGAGSAGGRVRNVPPPEPAEPAEPAPYVPPSANGGRAGTAAGTHGGPAAGGRASTAVDETDILVPSHAAVAPPPPQAAPRGTAAGKGEPVTPAVQAMYDRGYTLYHQKHYVDAEASFVRFLQAEPGSELAPNAQYWIGECRYSRGDMRGALAAFRETMSRYPSGSKTPDAMLKAGMSLEALGDREGARTTYQEILRRYPGTAVAAVAEERRAKVP